jgi:hypothetical protein
VNLERTDEMFQSPATGIQQVASRGNAFWRWTYELKDISLSERETVQAFLAKCRGSLNTFKVSDPANYEIRGSVSDWVDLYSDQGQFVTDAGSADAKINSQFFGNPGIASHITDEQIVRATWENYVSVGYVNHVDATGIRSQLESGKAYVTRIKFFQHPDRVATRFSHRVTSSTATYLMQASPRVNSTGMISAPFYVADSAEGYSVAVVAWTNITGNPATAGRKGDYFGIADYRLARCALVANSENLLKQSNAFDISPWSTTRTTVDSGYGELGPTGVNSYAWKLYGNTQTNTEHYLSQTHTKIMTEDIYTLSVYARADPNAVTARELRLRLQTNGSNKTDAIFWLQSGTITNGGTAGNFYRGTANIFDVGSGWYRCSITGLVNSLNNIAAIIYPTSGTSPVYTNNGSDGVLIADAQLTKHPFAGHFMPTTDTAVVGTNWQTGSNLIVDGLDPGDRIKAGTRCEIVNQFANAGSGKYERREFKKITEEVGVGPEGWAILPIDPPIRNAPETMRMSGEQQNFGETMHNPVIFSNPELTARLLGGTVQYIEKPLQLTDVVFEVIEDLSE